MHLALARLAPYGWNRRVLTETDFHQFCRVDQIKVIEMPLANGGCYVVHQGRRYIIIDSNLRGVRWLYVAFHELIHHLLHAPQWVTDFNSLEIDSKQEREADALALCALIPEPLLRRMLAYEIIEEYGYTWQMLQQRLKVLDLYGV